MMVDDPSDEDLDRIENGEDVEDATHDEVVRLLAENATLKEQALRFAAEAENTKRRAERESNDARAYAIQRFARDLLDAADNLARALEHAPKDSADQAVATFVTGVEMTEKALQTAFERNGLKRINPAKGEKFDPNLHQAMMEQPVADQPPGSVVQAMQAGYELQGRLMRPAMVVVTPKGPAASQNSGGDAAPYGSQAKSAGASVDQKA